MSSPPLNEPGNRAGLFKRPVHSSASSRWLQALVQNRKQLRVRSFVLAAWPSCRGPRQPAANELGGGPVRHVRLTELERLAGPSAPRCPFRKFLASFLNLTLIRPWRIKVAFKLLGPWTKPCAPLPLLTAGLTERSPPHQRCPGVSPTVRMDAWNASLRETASNLERRRWLIPPWHPWP